MSAAARPLADEAEAEIGERVSGDGPDGGLPPDRDFDDFYAATFARVARQVYALTADAGEAQDIVQEAYVRAWRHWRKVGGYERPEAWVRTVAVRMAVSRWRRTRTFVSALRRHGPPAPVPSPDPDHVALVAALARLPREQRLVIVLHHLADLPVDEVAAQLGCPVGSVKSRLSRGRAALAGLLADPVDAGATETGPAETGPAETGPAETGPAETGPAGTGPVRTGPRSRREEG